MIIQWKLPYPDPPLRSNKRMHWRVEHNRKKDIRQAGRVTAADWMSSARGSWTFPLPMPVHVCLVWSVPTKHRRDADAGQPTLKSYLDGIVDAGLLRDDSWQWVPRAYCEIEYRPGEPMSLRLEITEVQTNA